MDTTMGPTGKKTRDYKRIILIDIRKEFFKGEDKIVEDIVFPFTGLLAELDRRDLDLLNGRQKQAKANADRSTGDINAGEYINADGYNSSMEPEYPHPGIHLSVDNEDEIIWYSSEHLTFTVDVHVDAELVQVPKTSPKEKAQRRLRDLMAKNDPRDQPFTVAFPITSQRGTPVKSGPGKRIALEQRYYKYSIKSGSLKPLDPHVEFHED